MQDYAEAVQWYSKAAEQGFAEAQYNLGVCYENGQGVAQNYAEAVQWYRKAAEQGDANAQYNLGVCYENGQGVAQDYAEAVQWYRKAAEQGDADAQYNLTRCYQNGYGVPQKYAETAADSVEKAAAFSAVPDTETLMQKAHALAAQKGNVRAQHTLGFAYFRGKNVPQDYAEAVKLFKKAAKGGYVPAMRDLAYCYYKGLGVKEDRKKAEKLYKKILASNDAGCRRTAEGYLRLIEADKRKKGKGAPAKR